jgi:hypothetical protein
VLKVVGIYYVIVRQEQKEFTMASVDCQIYYMLTPTALVRHFVPDMQNTTLPFCPLLVF